MTTTNAYKDPPGAIAPRSAKLKAVMQRWHRALLGIRESLLSGGLRQRIGAARRDRRAREAQLAHGADERPELMRADPATSDAESQERAPVSLPDDRSQALAVLCDRLLHELDAEEVNGAEIRFVVHKREQSGYPRLERAARDGAGHDELVLELRRLIAWSGGTIADVAQVLEDRGAALDKNARELLRDEVEALDVDLAILNAFLADPVDWDTEFGCLLSGEVAPFDDLAGDEDDEDRDSGSS